MRLVDAVGEPGADQVEIGALDPEDELGGGGDVVGDVGERQLGGQRGAGGVGRDLLVAGSTRIALDALGRRQAAPGPAAVARRPQPAGTA